MEEPNDLICIRCRHFDLFGGGCRAFPAGIPDEVIRDNQHDKPLPRQGNDIVFEPIKKPAK